MAKKRIKLTPAGILFLIAIGVLLIALVAVIVVLSTTCGGERDATRANASAEPSVEASIEPTDEPETTETPEATDMPEPTDTPDTSGLDPIGGATGTTTGTDDPGTGVVITTPSTTNTPSATATIYTSPTSKQKKAAKSGYVCKDDVNMRKGPDSKKYDIVKKGIAQNTTVTLYELQDGWWFLKCGSSYGYIRKDFIKEGKPEATAKPTASSSSDSSYDGTIKTNSVAALRKSASKSSDCIRELKNGDKVTVYYKTKDKDGNSWYYLSDGKNKGYVSASLVSTSKKVPTK